MAQIRGFALRGLLRYLKSAGRAGDIPALLAELPATVAEVFDQPIHHPAWYPYPAYGELLRVVDRRIGRGDLALMPEIGRFAAQNEGATSFEFLASISCPTPEVLLRHAAPLWRQYCDTGRFETTEVYPGGGVTALLDFPEIAVEHCHLVAGWIEGMALAAGAETSEVTKIRCVHRGDDRCEYLGRWR